MCWSVVPPPPRPSPSSPSSMQGHKCESAAGSPLQCDSSHVRTRARHVHERHDNDRSRNVSGDRESPPVGGAPAQSGDPAHPAGSVRGDAPLVPAGLLRHHRQVLGGHAHHADVPPADPRLGRHRVQLRHRRRRESVRRPRLGRDGCARAEIQQPQHRDRVHRGLSHRPAHAIDATGGTQAPQVRGGPRGHRHPVQTDRPQTGACHGVSGPGAVRPPQAMAALRPHRRHPTPAADVLSWRDASSGGKKPSLVRRTITLCLDTPLLRTHFHVRRHFVRIPHCCYLTHGIKN